MRRFSDFAIEQQPLDGEKSKIVDILDKEILVVGHALKKSKYGKNDSGFCLTIQYELDEKRFICFTGSDVLIEQFKKYAEHIPFLTTVKRIDKYFTLS
jgi:hypothetical protein